MTHATSTSGFVPTTEPDVERNLAKEVAARINCTLVQEIGIEESPIRGGAAVRGVTCEMDGHRHGG